MILATLCLCFAITMIFKIHYKTGDNPNGVSVSIFQKIISVLDYALCRFRIISVLLFSINPEESDAKRVEKIVWSRLCVVCMLFILYELLCLWDKFPYIFHVRIILCTYIFLLQISMINSLVKPLFGVKRTGKGLELDQVKAQNKTVTIPTPKRSLLLALVNLFEIIISWGIIYRSIMPTVINTADQANYFSIVTITTLGYGDISGKEDHLVQIAVSLNMIIFVLFSICHITTILGTLTNKDS